MCGTNSSDHSTNSLTISNVSSNRFGFSKVKLKNAKNDIFTNSTCAQILRESKIESNSISTKKCTFTNNLTKYKNVDENGMNITSRNTQNDNTEPITNLQTLRALHDNTSAISTTPDLPSTNETISIMSSTRRSIPESICSSRVSIIKPASIISVSGVPVSLPRNKRRALKTRAGLGVLFSPAPPVLRGLSCAAARDNNASDSNNSNSSSSNSLAHDTEGRGGDNGRGVCCQIDNSRTSCCSDRNVVCTDAGRSSKSDVIYPCSSDVTSANSNDCSAIDNESITTINFQSEVSNDPSTNGHNYVPVDRNDSITDNKTGDSTVSINAANSIDLENDLMRFLTADRNDDSSVGSNIKDVSHRDKRSNNSIVYSDFNGTDKVIFTKSVTKKSCAHRTTSSAHRTTSSDPDTEDRNFEIYKKSSRSTSRNDRNGLRSVFCVENKNIRGHKNKNNRLADNRSRKMDIRFDNTEVKCISDKNINLYNTAIVSKTGNKTVINNFNTYSNIRMNKNTRTNVNKYLDNDKYRTSRTSENYTNDSKNIIDNNYGKINDTNTKTMNNHCCTNLNVGDICESNSAAEDKTGKYSKDNKACQKEGGTAESSCPGAYARKDNGGDVSAYCEMRNNKNLDPSNHGERVGHVSVRKQDMRKKNIEMDSYVDDIITGAPFERKPTRYAMLFGPRPEDRAMTGTAMSNVAPGVPSSSREETHQRKGGISARNFTKRIPKNRKAAETSAFTRTACKVVGSVMLNKSVVASRLVAAVILVHLLSSSLGVAAATTIHDRHITWGRAPAPSPSSSSSSSSNSSSSSSSSSLSDVDPSQNASAPRPQTVFRDTSRNVTAVIGHTARLPCSVVNLGLEEVSWIRQKDLHILTVGYFTYTSDDRFKVHHVQGSEDWVLEISSVTFGDAGVYECQVSASPKVFLPVHLTVLGVSRARIPGPESIYVRAGSTIRLQCELKAAEGAVGPITWLRDDAPLDYSEMRGGVVTETQCKRRTYSSPRER